MTAFLNVLKILSCILLAASVAAFLLIAFLAGLDALGVRPVGDLFIPFCGGVVCAAAVSAGLLILSEVLISLTEYFRRK